MASPAPEPTASLAEDPETATLSSGRVTYGTFGDPDGVPVVALHGMPGSRVFGAFFDGAARERGVRVIAPDRPSVGGSDPEPNRRVYDTAARVEALLDALDVDAAGVLGFSAGGPHALACASALPERVFGTALLASPAPPDAGVEVTLRTRVVGALARQDPAALLGLLTDAPIADAVVLDDYTIADVAAADVDVAFAQGHDALAAESRALTTDWGFDPGTVGSTVHVFHGREDENVPPAAADHFERFLPDVHHHRYPDCDHLELLLEAAGDALDASTGSLDVDDPGDA